jgi:protein O-GlcNAc transferase
MVIGMGEQAVGMTIEQALRWALELGQKGQVAEAAGVAQQILKQVPNQPVALCILAQISLATGQSEAGAAYAQQAIRYNPNNAQAHMLLGFAAMNLNRLDEGIAAMEKAAALEPNNPAGHMNLGVLLARGCQTARAYAATRRALELSPHDHVIHSNLVMLGVDLFVHEPERVFEEHRAWARAHADPLAKELPPHRNNPDPERRLKIGYVAAIGGEQAPQHFLEPVLAAHDREQFEVACYWTAPYSPNDAGAIRFHRYPHRWTNVSTVTDLRFAEAIRADAIDILVDVSGHTRCNRLLGFARKPAPVQVTHIGYQDTTGMTAIDYRFSDEYADPPGMTERYFSEKIVRLPRTGYCFRAHEASPGVSELPATKNGFITFGSTNRVSKMSPETIDSWCRVMHNVPGSKMIIRSDGLSIPMLQRQVTEQFAARGIGADRLELLGWSNIRDYLETFHRIDIVLDCFPFAGHTVSCHALWMGVPVVSRVGRTHTSRMGLSILSNLGLPELTAADGTEFELKATDLARDLPRLAELRRTLRGRMAASPLMDEKAYARELARAYREMWRTWCRTAK